MNKNVYSFRIAFQSEEQLKQLQEQQDVDPESLLLTTLDNGLPSYKTLYTTALTEDEAIKKMDAYVSRVSYRDLPDGKII